MHTKGNIRIKYSCIHINITETLEVLYHFHLMWQIIFKSEKQRTAIIPPNGLVLSHPSHSLRILRLSFQVASRILNYLLPFVITMFCGRLGNSVLAGYGMASAVSLFQSAYCSSGVLHTVCFVVKEKHWCMKCKCWHSIVKFSHQGFDIS